MSIGKIMITDKDKKCVIGSASGNLMIKGEKEGTFYDLYSNVIPPDVIERRQNDNDKPDLERIENYLPFEIDGVLGGKVLEMFSLYAYEIRLSSNGCLYGTIDIGKFEFCPLFANSPKRRDNGVFEWPLIQLRELSGFVPLTDENNRCRLEEVAFGNAHVRREIKYGESIYYRQGDGLLVNEAAAYIVGITREQFRELAKPVEQRLLEYARGVQNVSKT